MAAVRPDTDKAEEPDRGRRGGHRGRAALRARSSIDITEDGFLILNTFDRDQEDEAPWLPGCLPPPRDALVSIRRQRLDLASGHARVPPPYSWGRPTGHKGKEVGAQGLRVSG